MNFGIAVLIVLAVWSVLSILVSVTVGNLAHYRDAEHFHLAAHARHEHSQRDRIAS